MKHIKQLHALLTILLADNFSSRSLEDNKKTMTDLIAFQGIVFDRKQRYGNPNYEPVPEEKDLKKTDDRLAQVIYDQLLAVDLTTLSIDQLVEMHKDYEICCYHRDVYRDGKVGKAESKVRSQILIKAQELEGVDEKVLYLNFVMNNSNGGYEEYGKAQKLLEEMGYDEEDAHIEEFGERPK